MRPWLRRRQRRPRRAWRWRCGVCESYPAIRARRPRGSVAGWGSSARRLRTFGRYRPQRCTIELPRPGLPRQVYGTFVIEHCLREPLPTGTSPDMRVALFITCFNDTLFPQTGQAVVRILERLGHQVEFPEDQTCCGQMHFNTGYATEAR